MSGFTEKPLGGDDSNPTAAYVSEGPSSPCYCTGRCRELGYCPCNPPAPRPCGHYFPWYGVIPPSYCPICGAYIGPVYCPQQAPQPYITYTVHT